MLQALNKSMKNCWLCSMIVETFSYQHAYSIQHFYLIFKKFPSNMLIPSNTLNRKSRVLTALYLEGVQNYSPSSWLIFQSVGITWAAQAIWLWILAAQIGLPSVCAKLMSCILQIAVYWHLGNGCDWSVLQKYLSFRHTL